MYLQEIQRHFRAKHVAIPSISGAIVGYISDHKLVNNVNSMTNKLI